MTTFTAELYQVVGGKQYYKLTRSNNGIADSIQIITLEDLEAQKATTQAKIDAIGGLNE